MVEGLGFLFQYEPTTLKPYVKLSNLNRTKRLLQ